MSVLGGKGLFFNRKGHKVFRKGRKGVLKGINGLLMCGAGRAPGMAGPLLWLLESCKFGDGLVKKCWRMNCWRTCRAYGREGDDGRKKIIYTQGWWVILFLLADNLIKICKIFFSYWCSSV